MSLVLVDSNILLDLFTEDPAWFPWSSEQVAKVAEQGTLGINAVIYAEISLRFERIEDLEDALPREILRLSLPWEAAFLAGKVFMDYRRAGGRKTSPLPDFFIGAHALVEGMTLLTRDPSPYRTYYPTLPLLCP